VRICIAIRFSCAKPFRNDFPAEQWTHIRTTNPVESTFSTVRLRTNKTKGAGSRIACFTMVLKLAIAAQKKWRALNGHPLIADVIEGVRFVDSVKEKAARSYPVHNS
jgi:putative transposase